MIRPILCALAVAVTSGAAAENLGQKGGTYQPDKDGREQLKDAATKKQHSGETDQFWLEFRDRNVAAIKNPQPLGIASAYGMRIEEHELKFTFPQDVKNERNQIIVKKGFTVEPLKIQPLTSGIVFIDGRDQRQVDYAISRGRKQPLKIVLTAGSPYDLRVKYRNEEWWGGGKTIPFYFDQRKMIIDTLQRTYGVRIATVPAVLFQRGDRLAIEFGMKP